MRKDPWRWSLHLLVAAGTVALAVSTFRSSREGGSHVRANPAIVPCGPGDAARGVFDAPPAGRVCIEREGPDYIKTQIRRGEVWEPEVVEQIERLVRPGDVAVDAGAHIGLHTLLLSRRVGPEGRVLAFEPQAKIYQELLVNLDLNAVTNVTAEFAALGDASGRASMDAAPLENEGATRLGGGGNRVEVRTIDAYRLERLDLLKVDVEGAEAAVLRGAAQTIRRCRPDILIEIAGGWRLDHAPAEVVAGARAVFDLLKAEGYEVRQVEGHNYLATPLTSGS